MEARMENLIFGAAYYPEYMPYERMGTDLSLMKRAGINTVRIAESTWSTWEPNEGEFDFSILIKTLEATSATGINVIVGTPTYAIPSWLQKKDPSVLVVDHNGQRFYGSRQIMDIVNPTFRFHAERIIRKMMEAVRPYRNVTGFQLDNETKYYDSCTPIMQKMFCVYMQSKFGTVENLNRTFGLAYWSNSIGKWEDFPDMRGCIHAGLNSEFDRFRRSMAADYLKWQSKIVSEYKRDDQFITHNFDFNWDVDKLSDKQQDAPYSHGMQQSINHYESSEAVTLASCDIYHPSQDALTGAEIAYGGDEIRALKNAPYLVLETETQGFKSWTPYPGQLRLQAYSHLASGACGVMYWNWHSIHNSAETYWKGVLSHDLEPGTVYDEVSRIGREFEELSPLISTFRKQNRVCLVIDTVSMDAIKSFPIDKNIDYNDVLHLYYDALYEMNIECDVLDVNALPAKLRSDDGKWNYDMMVTPMLYCVSDDTVKLIKEFTAQGGVLVSSFRSFVSDRELTVYHDRLPHGLNDVFGMHYDQFTDPGKMTLQGTPVRAFAELVITDGAETMEAYSHRYWGKYAGITKHDYKDGCAYYIACLCNKDMIKKVYADARKSAKLEHIVPKEQWPVIIRSGVLEDGAKLHYVLHYSESAENLSCPYDRVTELISGKEYNRGDSIPLGDWGVSILREYSPADDIHNEKSNSKSNGDICQVMCADDNTR